MNGRTLRSKHRHRSGCGATRKTRRSDKAYRDPAAIPLNPAPYSLRPIYKIVMPDLAAMEAAMMQATLIGLRTKARERGMSGYSKLSKKELARQIVQFDNSKRGNR